MSSHQEEYFDAHSQLVQDRKSVDEHFFGTGYDFTSTGEDTDDFHSARSHVSDDDDASAWETISDYTSDAAASPNSSPEVGLNAESFTRILSEEENARLNDKIDRLIAAVRDGRQVHFEPDPATGEVNVSAEYPSQSFDEEESELEANIAASPENFGNLLPPGYRIRRKRSLTSMISIESITSSGARSRDSSNAWERAIAEADERYQREQGAPIQGVSIRKALRMQEENAGEPRGHRLARVGPTGVEVLSVWPVPFDFNKAKPAKTPSIRSEGSTPSCSSPLWMKSCMQMILDTDIKASTEANLGEKIAAWFARTETPPGLNLSRAFRGKRKPLAVFKDAEASQLGAESSQKPAALSKILKDVSNLRPPGYLDHNSFANEKRVAEHAALMLPSKGFGEASDEQARRSYIKAKWPGLLQSGRSTGIEIVERFKAPATIGLSGPTQDRVREKVALTPEQPVEQDPERAAHFEKALARLEGRATPEPTSPIRRYAHEDGVYGSDVEVDIRPLRSRQPRAIRYMDGTVAQRFERLLGVDIDRGIDPHAHLRE